MQFWLEIRLNARIMIIHVCFIALTLAGSLLRCLSTRPCGLMFKQFSVSDVTGIQECGM